MTSLHPLDPDARTEPITRLCMVHRRRPDGSYAVCNGPYNGRTILGYALCDDCYTAIHDLENPLA